MTCLTPELACNAVCLAGWTGGRHAIHDDSPRINPRRNCSGIAFRLNVIATDDGALLLDAAADGVGGAFDANGRLRYRTDALAKVTGEKSFSRDFRARDLPGWPSEQSPRVVNPRHAGRSDLRRHRSQRVSCWTHVIGLFRSRAALEAEILVLRHQLNVLRRKSPKRLAFSSIDRLVFAGSVSAGSGRVGRAENSQAGDGDPLASRGFPSLLALEITAARWTTHDTSRDSPAHSRDEYREPAVGSAADPRRTAQARHRCRADHRGKIHGAGEGGRRRKAGRPFFTIMPMPSRRWTCSWFRRSRFGCCTDF